MEKNKDIKIMYCKKCQKKTEHLKTHFRKPMEAQWWRCLNKINGKECGEERQ